VSTLLFLRRQEKLYLFQIWTGGEKDGNQIPLLNEEERRDRYGAASSIVRLRAQTRSYHISAVWSGQPAIRRGRLWLFRIGEQPSPGIADAIYVLIRAFTAWIVLAALHSG